MPIGKTRVARAVVLLGAVCALWGWAGGAAWAGPVANAGFEAVAVGPPVGAEENAVVGETDADVAEAAPVREAELLPLGAAGAAERSARREEAGSAAANVTGSDWILRTAGALTIVLGAIWATRWVLRKLAMSGGLAGQLGAGGRAPSGVLEVLARYPVGRGQTLVLLRMDRRVLLLSQTSQGFSTLAEVSEAEEVASLLVRTRDEEGDSLSSRFSSVLRSMERDEGVVEGVRTIDLTRGDQDGSAVGSVRRRLRLLKGEAA